MPAGGFVGNHSGFYVSMSLLVVCGDDASSDR